MHLSRSANRSGAGPEANNMKWISHTLLLVAIAILVGLIKMAAGRKKAGGDAAPAKGDPAPTT